MTNFLNSFFCPCFKKIKNGENMEDNRGKAVNKFVRTEEMINDVKRFIEEDRRVDVAQLASVFDVSTTGTIFNIIHDDLGLVKKSARWVPKLLSQEQKDNRIACSRELKKAFKVIRQPPYSPDLAPADFFLFPKVKNALAGVHLDDGELKKAWDGVTATIAAAEWMVFNAWVPRCHKCIDVDGNFVEK